MSDHDKDDEARRARAERLAALKRYNMKSLGRLVESNRLTGVMPPETVAPGGPEPLPHRTIRPRVDDAGGIGVADEHAPDHGAGPVATPAVDPADTGVEAIVDQVEAAEPTAPADDDAPVGASRPTSIRVVVDPESDDGVDRSDLGAGVTRSGLSSRLDEPVIPRRHTPSESESPLARLMLDGEIGAHGRISDPRDVPGLVLALAKDVPASVAVSVVRVDEEVEIVGDTLEPGIDPSVYIAAFSALFRSIRPAAKMLEDGPMGAIQDVVIEGEKMDLVLRPLGARYYLMVLEDRKDSRSNLALTRLHMAAIAPGLTAILAHQDGEN